MPFDSRSIIALLASFSSQRDSFKVTIKIRIIKQNKTKNPKLKLLQVMPISFTLNYPLSSINVKLLAELKWSLAIRFRTNIPYVSSSLIRICTRNISPTDTSSISLPFSSTKCNDNSGNFAEPFNFSVEIFLLIKYNQMDRFNLSLINSFH